MHPPVVDNKLDQELQVHLHLPDHQPEVQEDNKKLDGSTVKNILTKITLNNICLNSLQNILLSDFYTRSFEPIRNKIIRLTRWQEFREDKHHVLSKNITKFFIQSNQD